MPAVAEIVRRLCVRGRGQAQGWPLPSADWRAEGRHKACPYLPLTGGQRAGTRLAPTFPCLEGRGQAQGLPLPSADWRTKGRHKACPYLPLRGRRWLRCYPRCRNLYPNFGPHPERRVSAGYGVMMAGVVAREDLSADREKLEGLFVTISECRGRKWAGNLRSPPMRRRQSRGAPLRRPALACRRRRHPGTVGRFRAGGGTGSPRELYPGL